MSDLAPVDQEFLNQLLAAIEANIANEQFGVSELADEMNMSRSNLLRKVKRLANVSVSQLIREVRLKRAMELLKTSAITVSEVSHQVGFSSTSYFIKCFREHYGYPPGEAGKRIATEEISEVVPVTPVAKARTSKFAFLAIGVALVIGLAAAGYWWFHSKSLPTEKSIIVLPFKNDSSDSTNLYLINGLMEATLSNLQQIKDLRVISRTSSEKYRNTSRSIPEMAKELNVQYFVEGSGQKIGNQILVNIQLIDGATDKHLWSKQYRRETKDIFALQEEIAKNIANEIEVILTPEEKRQIAKKPTDDLVAYDYFLKAEEEFRKSDEAGFLNAIPLFKKAIEQDADFAEAYAELAMVYYYLDAFLTDKKYGAEINTLADKAMLLDPKSTGSLVAKAVYYMQNKQYQQALPYFEKALEYNPNSSLVIAFLSSIYNNFLPNTTKYLEYALRGARLDIMAHDSTETSNNYLRLSDALLQSGFVDLSLTYVNKSLDYNPNNLYANWVKSFVLFVRTKDLTQTKNLLLAEFAKDTTNILMMEEIGKVYYMMNDFKGAYPYYQRFLEMRERHRLELFTHENLKIAFVFLKMGEKAKADKLLEQFHTYALNDHSIYRNLQLAGYDVYVGDDKNAFEHLRLFSKEDNFQYWVLLITQDPLMETLRKNPEFKVVFRAIEDKFWANHERVKITLEEKGLL